MEGNFDSFFWLFRDYLSTMLFKSKVSALLRLLGFLPCKLPSFTILVEQFTLSFYIYRETKMLEFVLSFSLTITKGPTQITLKVTNYNYINTST